MARCKYCGRQAGFLHKEHSECRNRYERAVSIIPGLFPQAMESHIPAKRFSSLLQVAAQDAYVGNHELKTLCTSGIDQIIDPILEDRLLSIGEIDRITDLIDALGDCFVDPVATE